MPRIILDTDIGTDVDDACALALALRSPEIQLAAVTTVHADVTLRSRMVAKLLRLGGRTDVPIGSGISLSLLRNRPTYWAGHEGVGLLGPEDEGTTPWTGHGVDLIVDLVRANPGEITLVPVGPLTNVAAAIIREPELPRLLRGIVLMGGVVRASDGLHLPWVEHNIRLDPEAAAVVFAAGAPLTMVGLDVTTQVSVRRSDLARLRDAGTPLSLAVADQLARYMDYRQRDFTYMHDPLAIAMTIDPTFCRTVPLHVQVETRGELTLGATVATGPTESRPANALVCVDVDAPRFVEFFLERVSRKA